MKIIQTLNRFYVSDINAAVDFYEKLLDETCGMRFRYPQINLELAQVGGILLIGGPEEALKPFKGTQATFLVDSVTQYKEFLLRNGAFVVRDILKVPTGLNMTVRHADGTIVEYVEHKPS